MKEDRKNILEDFYDKDRVYIYKKMTELKKSEEYTITRIRTLNNYCLVTIKEGFELFLPERYKNIWPREDIDIKMKYEGEIDLQNGEIYNVFIFY